MNFKDEDLSLLLEAVKFSAEKHKNERRKGAEGSPYINHPIDVAETLWNLGGVRDISVIVAAILHDTVEDTETTLPEIEEYFGPVVRSLVQEVTDDKSLPKPKRKRLQIEHAPHLSKRFTRACEALARVRKWSRNTPTLQVNIGVGQQVNLA